MTPFHRTLLFAVAVSVASLALPEIGHAGKSRSRANKHQIPLWRWNPKATTFSWYRSHYRGKLKIVAPRRLHLFRRLPVRVTRRGRTLATFKAHRETAFVVIDDRVLVYSLHHPISTGCTLVAIDLRRGKQRWKTNLKGVGPVAHSKYRNRINLVAGPGAAVTVFGTESYGRYVEVVDLKTGKTLHHRKVPR